jgi:hypothetical protein
MKRTFNYTGRKKIERKDVSITVRDEHGSLFFDAELRLAAYQFPRNAEVWLEVHRQNLWMQFPWGTVSALRVPTDRKLTEFDVSDGILFRVRVVQPQGQEHHKLLGEADGVHFIKVCEPTDRRRPLITPEPEALDQLLWKLDMESDPPRLLVNKDAKPSYRDLVRSPYFISLVYPEVLRRLLTRALVQEKWTEDDDEGGWTSDWMKFARNLGVPWPPPAPAPDLQADCEAWIEEAVAAFARRNQLRNVWDLTHDEEGSR